MNIGTYWIFQTLEDIGIISKTSPQAQWLHHNALAELGSTGSTGSTESGVHPAWVPELEISEGLAAWAVGGW